MENVTLKTVIGQLEELFQIFNKRFYNGEDVIMNQQKDMVVIMMIGEL